ncbi:alpha/beta hydrolase [Marinobacter sp. SS21]|uniref:alpha/beta hydrolase n=1 Tax=Marinobacter sp. SS21 TaxID=2979460 RepID=UPI00232FB5B0|nr:alpha/beta hydrolase [Marinobacter sp. SS21]MDC0662673.1 alpha/beta hydrolase [Marinobacter sp. SS21]
MNIYRHDSASTAAFTQVFKHAKGHWKYSLLNLLLRVSVKWRHGLEVDVSSVRDQVAKLDRQAPKQLPDIKRLKADADGVSGEWLVPDNHHENRVVLYLHGGAFVASSPNVHATMLAPWCQTLGARALMVDYRLSPEHRFPAASDDCFVAYKWLLEQGIEPRNIVIAGDSAGGNLVLSTLLRLKTEQVALPGCAVLLSPFLDFTLSGRSALTNARKDPIFTSAFAIGVRNHYAPAELHSDPRVSPLLGDFEGLPPMLFQVGSTEMLLDDSVRAANKASDAKVPVQLEIWEDLPHVFQTIDALPQAKVAAQRICQFIEQHTGWAN